MLPIIASIARVVFILVTSVIFVVALLSYSRLRTKKMLLLTSGFGLFFIHSLISIPELFNQGYNRDFTDSIHILIDSIALLLILVGALKD